MSAPGLRAAGLDGPLWVGLVPPVTPPPDYKQLGQSIYRKPSTAREKPHRPSSAGATSPSAVSGTSPRVRSDSPTGRSQSAAEKPETALEVERQEAIAAAAAAREAAVLRAEAQRIAGREAREAIARERAAGRTPLSPLSESTTEADAEAAAAQAMAENLILASNDGAFDQFEGLKRLS